MRRRWTHLRPSWSHCQRPPARGVCFRHMFTWSFNGLDQLSSYRIVKRLEHVQPRGKWYHTYSHMVSQAGPLASAPRSAQSCPVFVPVLFAGGWRIRLVGRQAESCDGTAAGSRTWSCTCTKERDNRPNKTWRSFEFYQHHIFMILHVYHWILYFSLSTEHGIFQLKTTERWLNTQVQHISSYFNIFQLSITFCHHQVIPLLGKYANIVHYIVHTTMDAACGSAETTGHQGGRLWKACPGSHLASSVNRCLWHDIHMLFFKHGMLFQTWNMNEYGRKDDALKVSHVLWCVHLCSVQIQTEVKSSCQFDPVTEQNVRKLCKHKGLEMTRMTSTENRIVETFPKDNPQRILPSWLALELSPAGWTASPV